MRRKSLTSLVCLLSIAGTLRTTSAVPPHLIPSTTETGSTSPVGRAGPPEQIRRCGSTTLIASAPWLPLARRPIGSANVWVTRSRGTVVAFPCACSIVATGMSLSRDTLGFARAGQPIRACHRQSRGRQRSALQLVIIYSRTNTYNCRYDVSVGSVPLVRNLDARPTLARHPLCAHQCDRPFPFGCVRRRHSPPGKSVLATRAARLPATR